MDFMNTPFFELKELWSPTPKYSNHRIPGILVTKKGTLIVYCEARQTSSDWAMMDILMQRSEDHGKNFSDPLVLASGTEEHPTVNNPVMVQDKNGRIHFLYCEDYTVNGGRALRRYSDDDGLTWSVPIDITEFTMPFFHNAFAFGPGHGIVHSDGTLIFPVWMVPKYYQALMNSHTPSVISTFYSKDNGQSWAIGDIITTNSEVINPNETVAALTSDGRVYLNIRTIGFYRAKAYSKNGYSDFTELGTDFDLPDPKCFGSVAAYYHENDPYSLIFVNCNDQKKRQNVTVRASFDDGKTFPVSKVIDAERGGYTEIGIDNKNGIIYVLYENNFGESDHLAVFNMAWLNETES